ncbi:MAG: hypothetical protein R8G66_06305 [Cytophagales bacterium]|nr:hypothetical protein [Cytophagales bacterium]
MLKRIISYLAFAVIVFLFIYRYFLTTKGDLVDTHFIAVLIISVLYYTSAVFLGWDKSKPMYRKLIKYDDETGRYNIIIALILLPFRFILGTYFGLFYFPIWIFKQIL